MTEGFCVQFVAAGYDPTPATHRFAQHLGRRMLELVVGSLNPGFRPSSTPPGYSPRGIRSILARTPTEILDLANTGNYTTSVNTCISNQSSRLTVLVVVANRWLDETIPVALGRIPLARNGIWTWGELEVSLRTRNGQGGLGTLLPYKREEILAALLERGLWDEQDWEAHRTARSTLLV
jgi:hypothetical protein